MLLRLTRTASILLVDSKMEKLKTYLRRENRKWVICVARYKAIHEISSTSILSCKKLPKKFRCRSLIMSPCDPCVWNFRADEKPLAALLHSDDLLITCLDSST